MMFLLVVVGIVFLFGLLQWARSGAVLWDIHSLLKRGSDLSSDAANTRETGRDETARRKESLNNTVQRMETTMDGLLRSSFRILGVLALCVWAFVTLSLIVDMLGLNWLDRLSFSSNRVIGNPTVRSGRSSSGFSFTGAGGSGGARGRGDTVRSMGSGLRR